MGHLWAVKSTGLKKTLPLIQIVTVPQELHTNRKPSVIHQILIPRAKFFSSTENFPSGYCLIPLRSRVLTTVNFALTKSTNGTTETGKARHSTATSLLIAIAGKWFRFPRTLSWYQITLIAWQLIKLLDFLVTKRAPFPSSDFLMKVKNQSKTSILDMKHLKHSFWTA